VYATWDDIRAHLPATFQSHDGLREAADDKQEAAEDMIVGMLGTIYTFPLTTADNPVAYRRVASLCARLTAARALKWFHADDMPEAVNAHAKDLEEEVMAELRRLIRGEDELTDAGVADDGPGTDIEDGYDGLTETEQDDLEPWFSRGDTW